MRLKPRLGLATAPIVLAMAMTRPAMAANHSEAHRPKGPCDIYAAAGDPCVAAYSTTRAMYASYDGSLYRITRQSDGKSRDIGVTEPVSGPNEDMGGYADATAQDAFCADTYCWITRLYDQSPQHNDLTQAPRGGWSGPALGGMDNVPLADMAPAMVGGHKVYGIFLEPGMGLRDDDPKGTAVDDQAQGEYWVVSGRHFNSGCCNDFGNAEIDSRDDDAGTMETTYFGDAPWWYHGKPPGPWVMTDQENNLVGCVNPDGSRLCAKLPDVRWRFLTAVAKGKPHHWTSMGGDAQRGALSVMFSGPRIDWRYDPMRKQGGIVLGNGGDNSNGSQGTFYEGAMTAAGTFPADATDQEVQANVVAAQYRALPVSIAPSGAAAAPAGLQSFSPRSTGRTTVTFTNTTDEPASNVRLSLALPGNGWTAALPGSSRSVAEFAGPVAPGASVSATFRVTSASALLNGDLIGEARWTGAADHRDRSVTRMEKVRNVPPVTINEFRIGTSHPRNDTNSFIELYNAGTRAVDISRWTLTEHPSQEAISSSIEIPAGTKLAARGLYLLALADSGLAVSAHAGDSSLYVRSTDGMKVGDTVRIGTGPRMELRAITRVGSPASVRTTLWQPLPDGPIIRIPRGSRNVPVQEAAGFAVGQKIALGYGATYPTVPAVAERYEIATVTAVGRPGTQAYLADAAPAGATNIKVTATGDISAGDRIRLDIASVGHGIETVTVTKVGTAASITRLVQPAIAGARQIVIHDSKGFRVGDRFIIATPASRQTLSIISLGASGGDEVRLGFSPALRGRYPQGAQVIDPGTGLELAAPLRFNHAANLPFSDRGTGISFEPATGFAHISNDPIRVLGTGVAIDRPLAHSHAIHAPLRDAAVSTAGYQGARAPDEWFGGPRLTSRYLLFGRLITAREGSMVLRNSAGLVVDSLDYGGLADPWAAEGYQGVSGFEEDGCYVATPGMASGAGASAARFPDGANTESNCRDFITTPVTFMPVAARAGARNIKVASITGWAAGQRIRIGTGAGAETSVIGKVGTPGATLSRAPVPAGATVIPVRDARQFSGGETVLVGTGATEEKGVISDLEIFDSPAITLSSPLTHALPAGTEVCGTGITLTAPLARHHTAGTEVAGSASTPGAPNREGESPRS